MNRFGVPLVPAALALIAMNLGDRFFLNHFAGIEEVGRYEIGVRIASAMVLLITAFRTAWPAFAYSIEDDAEAKRTYAYVLTYLVALASWLALALGVLSPWLVRLLATPDVLRGRPRRRAARVRRRRLRRLHRDGDRRRPREADAVQLGDHGRRRARQRRAQPRCSCPSYGMIGSAIAAVAAYTAMFLGMTWYAQRVFPTPYQWRRVATAAGAARRAHGRSASCSTCRSPSRSRSSPPTRSRCSCSASSCRRSGARSARAHGSPGVPGDLQDHERDPEPDQRVGALEPERDDDRARDDTERDEAVGARVVAVGDQGRARRAAARRAAAPEPRSRCRRSRPRPRRRPTQR